MELFQEGFFEENVQAKDGRGRNGLHTSMSTDATVCVTEVRFGKKYRFWSFWNTEHLDRQAARAKAEAIVSAKLMLES